MPIQINGLPVTTDGMSALNNGEKFIAACHVYRLVFARLLEKAD
jgi:hypothetical protein